MIDSDRLLESFDLITYQPSPSPTPPPTEPRATFHGMTQPRKFGAHLREHWGLPPQSLERAVERQTASAEAEDPGQGTATDDQLAHDASPVAALRRHYGMLKRAASLPPEESRAVTGAAASVPQMRDMPASAVTASTVEPQPITSVVHSATPFGNIWLEAQCRRHVERSAGSARLRTSHERASIVLATLRSCSATDNQSALQSELVDLLGYDDLDFVATLVGNRESIISAHSGSDTGIETSQYAIARETPLRPSAKTLLTAPSLAPPLQPLPPPQVVQFTINTAAEKRAAKEQRKLDRVSKRAAAQDEREFQALADDLQLGGEELRALRDNMLLENARRPLFSSQQKLGADSAPRYPHVYDALYQGAQSAAASTAATMAARAGGFALPADAERRNTKEFEEVVLPVRYPAKPPESERPVGIDQLEWWSRPCFAGYKSLNRMQSIVFPVAYRSNENMLVCAPTGRC